MRCEIEAVERAGIDVQFDRNTSTGYTADIVQILFQKQVERADGDEGRGQTAEVDIVKPSVNILDPATGTSIEMMMPSKVSAAVPTRGGMLVALEDGLWLRDRGGSFSRCASPDMMGVQFNDGKCDPVGRFWVGSRSSDGTLGKGKLHSLGLDGVFREAADGFDVCNGLGWSPDRRAFYLIDTVPRILYRFDYDCAAGRISGKSILRRFNEDEGKPDGLVVDAQGNIWCAMWDAAASASFLRMAGTRDGYLFPAHVRPVARSGGIGGPVVRDDGERRRGYRCFVFFRKHLGLPHNYHRGTCKDL